MHRCACRAGFPACHWCARAGWRRALRSLGAWLREYGLSHRHPANTLLHLRCVPPLVLAAAYRRLDVRD